jgi:hypothetical protein
MPSGLPVATGVSASSGSGRKNTRQPGESWDLFDAIDIRNLGAAKPKRIVAAGLLLLGGVGLARRGQHRHRQRRGEHQTDVAIPGPESGHESPEAFGLRRVGEWRGVGKEGGTNELTFDVTAEINYVVT